jgi:hypothetical protein
MALCMHFPFSFFKFFSSTKQKNGFCILDCIFSTLERNGSSGSNHEGSYYVLDILCWKGFPIHDSEAEFRIFWVQTKLFECGYRQRSEMSYNSIEFYWLPVCSAESLKSGEKFYSRNAMESYDSWGFKQDGVLLINKHASYFSGTNPFLLFWKDAFCSPYLIEEENFKQTDDGYRQYFTLKVEEDSILTLDDCVIGSIKSFPEYESLQKEQNQHPQNLYKFSILDIIVDNPGSIHRFFEEEEEDRLQVEVLGLKFESTCSKSRTQADHLSKIVFNRNSAQKCGITIADIMSRME